MKIVVMVDKKSYDRYSKVIPKEWEIIHLEADCDDETLVETNADAILMDPMSPLKGSVISKMKTLKIIHSLGVGYNLIDLEAAKEAGIYVCNNAGVNGGAVAEQAILLMLAALRHFREAEDTVYAAKQIEYKIKCFTNGLIELGSCKVGLLGFGAIGKATALGLAGFGTEVWYHKPSPLSEENIYNAESHSMEEILRECDIVSLHMPVLPETINIIDEKAINMMKPGAILVNTSRGELVDQDAVCKALLSGHLGMFAADTLYPEPVQPDNPIINLPESIRNRLVLSPHIGGITEATFIRSYEWVVENFTAVFEGKRPKNIVNGL